MAAYLMRPSLQKPGHFIFFCRHHSLATLEAVPKELRSGEFPRHICPILEHEAMEGPPQQFEPVRISGGEAPNRAVQEVLHQ